MNLSAIKPWLPVLLWAAIIFLFSANPDPYRFLPAGWRSAVPLPTLTNSSAAELLGQLMHFLEYAVLSFLLSRMLFITRQAKISNDPNTSRIEKIIFFKISTAQQLNSLIAVVLSMLFAFSDEIHQLYVPGRAFQVIDLFIDFLGVIVGVFVYTKIKNRTAKAQRHEDY